ncbi:MAG: polyprenyl synthetase family protein [Pirellulaceae bacterium]
MSQTVNHQPSTADVLRALYAPIAEEMQQVEAVLRRELRSRYSAVDELVRYGCLLGGKRLRPALLLLSAQATGEVTPDHRVLAAVVEMIHTATLIHDDVLDEADQRRHLATVNSRWDNKSSVLLGDYLFTHSFYLASTLDSTLACRLIGRATNIVCEGELRQIANRGNFELDEAEYLDIIEAKTAELCSCGCRLGAQYAGASEEVVERMAAYGRDLGIAFQIADDLLDVLGDEATTGKSLGTDLDQRKPTLPLIRVLELADADERRQLLDLLQGDSPRLAQVLPGWLERYGAVEYAREKALDYSRRAVERLDALSPSPAVDVLRTIAQFAVLRSQ